MEDQLKWQYIELISRSSDHYGNQLLVMMEQYGVKSLREITQVQAEEFWNQIKTNKRKFQRDDPD